MWPLSWYWVFNDIKLVCWGCSEYFSSVLKPMLHLQFYRVKLSHNFIVRLNRKCDISLRVAHLLTVMQLLFWTQQHCIRSNFVAEWCTAVWVKVTSPSFCVTCLWQKRQLWHVKSRLSVCYGANLFSSRVTWLGWVCQCWNFGYSWSCIGHMSFVSARLQHHRLQQNYRPAVQFTKYLRKNPKYIISFS